MIVKRSVKKDMSLGEFFEYLYLPKNLCKDLLNKKRVLKNDIFFTSLDEKLKKGDLVSFDLDDYEKNDILEKDGKIDIVYEDSDIILLNKKRGELVHSDGERNDTLTNFLSFYLKEKVRCIHRIDLDTTGLVLFSKNIISYHYLNKQMENFEIIKEYVAVIEGYLKDVNGKIELNISKDRHRNNRYIVNKNGKYALTHYVVLKKKRGMSKLLINIKTGRTHQIRVHFAYIKHPLIGDNYYGSGKGVLLLHSYKLTFKHPATYEYFECSVREGKEFDI